MTATNDILQNIHRQAAETYLRMTAPREEMVMVGGEPVMVDGVPLMRTVFPTAAEMNAANAFLKQNNITAPPEEDDNLAELRNQLAQRRRRQPVILPDDDGERIFQ